MRIYKYEVNLLSKNYAEVEIPEGGEVLKFDLQKCIGSYCLWVKVNPDNKPEKRTFKLFVTGFEEIPENSKYIDTIQMDNANSTGCNTI